MFAFMSFGAPPAETNSPELERGFPAQPESVPEARRFVLNAAGSGYTQVDERLSALVSELATNAILHARTPFRVKVWRDGSRTRVSVSDHSTSGPITREYAPSQPTGRGLMIVESLADRWGVTPDHDGKTVWFEIDYQENG
ncbi:MAG: ATP-binding protein [Acidimicrobiia bacterium]